MKALLFGLLFIVTCSVSAQITIPRTIINSYTLEVIESLTAETNGKSLHVTRNESVFTIHGVNLADRITLHSPGLKSISLSQPFGEETLFMDPTDSMKRIYQQSFSFYQPLEIGDALTFVDTPPEFPGGVGALRKFLANEIRYPEVAIDHMIKGKVFLQFIVEADGTINAVTIRKGACLPMDKESVRVALEMPKWTPGMVGGKAVRTVYNLPINYSVQ